MSWRILKDQFIKQRHILNKKFKVSNNKFLRCVELSLCGGSDDPFKDYAGALERDRKYTNAAQ